MGLVIAIVIVVTVSIAVKKQLKQKGQVNNEEIHSDKELNESKKRDAETAQKNDTQEANYSSPKVKRVHDTLHGTQLNLEPEFMEDYTINSDDDKNIVATPNRRDII